VRAAVALGLGATFVVLLTGCGGGDDGDGGGGRQGGPLIIDILEQNGSGESGSAELTPQNGRTDVLVTTGGLSGGVPNPNGVYEGTCDGVGGEPKYKLPDLQEGIGATTLDVSLDDLMDSHSIAVLKSSSDDTVVACGEIKEPEQ
jgi:hypothetical protein